MDETTRSGSASSYLFGGLGCLGLLVWASVVLGWGGAALWASAAFLQDYWGWHWFLAAVAIGAALAVFPGLLVPTTFFGAWLVWQWPFLGALAFAAPGLAFAAVALASGGVLSLVSRLFGSR